MKLDWHVKTEENKKAAWSKFDNPKAMDDFLAKYQNWCTN